MPDLNDPVVAGATLAGCLGILIIAIAMDARKLPLGKVKMMPWTMITLVMLFAVIMAGRNFAIVLMS